MNWSTRHNPHQPLALPRSSSATAILQKRVLATARFPRCDACWLHPAEMLKCQTVPQFATGKSVSSFLSSLPKRINST